MVFVVILCYVQSIESICIYILNRLLIRCRKMVCLGSRRKDHPNVDPYCHMNDEGHAIDTNKCEKKVTVMATVLFASTLLIAQCIDVSFTFHLLHSFLALIVSCCRFSSHTIKHSPVRCTSTFVSGQAIRFTMSKCWLSTPSSNYMVARWTTFRKNYRNGKVFLATQFVSLNFLYFSV